MAYDAETTERTVTRDRVMRLRDFLKALPDERFNIQNIWTRKDGQTARSKRVLKNCGTAACILGWAGTVLPDQQIGVLRAGGPLGLTYLQATDLFCPRGFTTEPDKFTRQRAVAVLDHLLATGEVDWSVAK